MKTGFKATVVADSVSPTGKRITTIAARLPRIILSELNTHKMLSKNSASSRAIPVNKMIAQVIDDPFVPIFWGKNKPGMQATEEMSPEEQAIEVADWLEDRDYAVRKARGRIERGLHKQTANRPLETWMWTVTLITGTEWTNFYALRDHKDAQPEMQWLARVMLEAHNNSIPIEMPYGAWHLPYITAAERTAWKDVDYGMLLSWSAARCARVSTLNHDGTNPDLDKDFDLATRLQTSGHMSPFEHQARPLTKDDPAEFTGNLREWAQLRKTLSGENRDHHPAYLWGR